jgi:hypothetical protein
MRKIRYQKQKKGLHWNVVLPSDHIPMSSNDLFPAQPVGNLKIHPALFGKKNGVLFK